ncbi:UNVERIFIED_CONTAM: putative anion transporter 6, chloroplastic [Sesamum latifolium]|uniref:Anion transporter 6, chloroplastic n=1 Tax=Sesamum latifolium TaxID=2727402 RepID=A0AAW2VCX6_9LAMI
MARIISKPSSDFFNFSYGKSTRASTLRTSVANQPLNGLPFKQSLKFRVSCSIKETERENAAETQRILSGLEVNGQLKKEDGLGEFGSGGSEVGFNWDWPPWKNLPQRYKLIGTTSLAFVVCNMDKVNLSVAIIPMSHQFGWNASVAGLVQSSFFWGYALSQLPGGWLAKIFGGRKVLEVGVLVWSLATAMVPVVAGFMPGLIFSRILVGIGEGVSPSAATDMIARLLSAPPLIQNYGWGSVFYIFGSLGIAWFSAFQFVREDEPPFRAPYLSWPQSNPMSKSRGSSLKELSSSLGDVPWKEFFKSKAVWAMIYAHFLEVGVTIPAYLGFPHTSGNFKGLRMDYTYEIHDFIGSLKYVFTLMCLIVNFELACAKCEELNLDLTEAAWVSVLPPLASVVVTSIASQLADSLISKGVETTVESTALYGNRTESMDVSILTGGLALSSFALSGLYCTHQDMSPEYASVLLGITNTVGAIPGIVGVALTGYLFDSTHSWAMSLFAPSIFFYLTGTIVWLALASSKPQTFSKTD